MAADVRDPSRSAQLREESLDVIKSPMPRTPPAYGLKHQEVAAAAVPAAAAEEEEEEAAAAAGPARH